MKNDKPLRKQLVKLLAESEAHIDFDSAVKNFPVSLRGKRPKGSDHSPWELLEHLRIAQWDILEFSRDPNHISPEFPTGYWPSKPSPPDNKAWDKTIKAFRADLKGMIDLVANPSTNLFAKIPHGDGQTVLRQALLTVDHNAYHLGQFMLLRKILGAQKS